MIYEIAIDVIRYDPHGMVAVAPVNVKFNLSAKDHLTEADMRNLASRLSSHVEDELKAMSEEDASERVWSLQHVD